MFQSISRTQAVKRAQEISKQAAWYSRAYVVKDHGQYVAADPWTWAAHYSKSTFVCTVDSLGNEFDY